MNVDTTEVYAEDREMLCNRINKLSLLVVELKQEIQRAYVEGVIDQSNSREPLSPGESWLESNTYKRVKTR